MKPNTRNKMDGLKLLRGVPDGAAACVVFDPQYRENMDALAYGNEGARQQARAGLPQQSSDTINSFLTEIARVLRPSGHLFWWVNKHTVGEGQHRFMLWDAAPELSVVDLQHWDTLTFGMGYRLRGVSEYCVVVQKPPIRSKGVWTDKSIKDSWAEQIMPGNHVHAKPPRLMYRLIGSVTSPGDLVVDPCAGGYGTLTVCRALGLTFMGADLVG